MGQAEEIIVIHCPSCGHQEPPDSEIEGITPRPRFSLVVCPKCREKRHRAEWEKVCPPYFRLTDVAKLPDQVHSQRALLWKGGTSKGLLMCGPSRSGKSRTAWAIIKASIFCGRTADYVDAARLSHLVLGYGRDSDALSILNRWCRVDLLLLDDVFKVKLTERVEEQIFNIVDGRMLQLLPIIVTSNDGEEGLLSRLSPDRGPALVERIKEMCEPITFGTPTV